MRRGEIRVVRPHRAPQSQSAGSRPAVIVSNDGANAAAARLGRGALTVVPVTSNAGRVYPFQVLLTAADTGLGLDYRAQAEQISPVSVARIGALIGVVSGDAMARLDAAIRLHLDL